MEKKENFKDKALIIAVLIVIVIFSIIVKYYSLNL